MILKFGIPGIGPLELLIFAVIALLWFFRDRQPSRRRWVNNFRQLAGDHTKRR